MTKIVLRDLQRNIILQYESNAIPHIGECIALPHFGLYDVLNVVYCITDDRDANELEELLWVDVCICKCRQTSEQDIKEKSN